MNPPSWFAVADGTSFRCAACHTAVDLGGPHLDHHPATCPACGVACAFLNWKGRVVQVVPAKAPAAFGRVLAWMQQNFDELDYVEFVAAADEVSDEVACTAQTAAAVP